MTSKCPQYKKQYAFNNLSYWREQSVFIISTTKCARVHEDL